MPEDPLQQLRDLHLPADPSWWPPAPGWWLLTLVCLAALGWTVVVLRRAWLRRRPRRAARQLLRSLNARHAQGELSAEAYVQQVNELLKRLLVRGLGRSGVAPLQGEAWLRWLDAEAGSRDFTAGAGQVLGDARFRPAFEVDAAALAGAVARLCERIPLQPPAVAGSGTPS